MKKFLKILSILIITSSCSSYQNEPVLETSVNREKVQPSKKIETETEIPTQTQNKSDKDDKGSNQTFNDVSKPFKQFGNDVEQFFDRLSTKDNDGDGE